jgi:four helix bundle protein
MLAMAFEKLQVWQNGIDLADKVYKLTALFPASETYGLVSQLRRAAVSIPSNIAEGSQRTTDKDFANFLMIARGSLAELKTQLILAVRFGYITREKYRNIQDDIERLSRMLHAFRTKLIAHSL